MSNRPLELVGVGLYTWQEASRLIAVPALELRRWLKGYGFRGREGEERHMPALWKPGLLAADVDGITFQDLLEARVVRALREQGLSLQFIRKARQEACVLFRTLHPFSTRRILTDGVTVFEQAAARDGNEEGDGQVLDIMKHQYAFKRVLGPSLRGVEFSADDQRALRWYPMVRRTVVIDPGIAFGKPIVTRGGVRTDVLADAVEVEGSKQLVAKLYEVPVEAVNAAIEFELRLAA